MVSSPEEIPERAGDDPQTPLRIAPDRYVLAEGAAADLGRYLDATGVDSAYVLGGERAYAAVRDDLEAGLERAGIDARYASFAGECCPSTVFDHRDRIDRLNPDVVVGVGGGKAIDTAKLAAEGRCPVATVPTSAATCAAWTALSVLHESDGAYRGGVSLSRCPELVVADLGVIADAPARLLANGVMDASAKHFETRLVAETERPATRWSLGLAEDAYLDELRAHARSACADVRADDVTPAVADVVEAVVAGPGLAAGLLSDRSYVGPAHAFCYAVLGYGAVPRRSCHGERVGYGVVLQRVLSDDDGPPGPSELLDWYGELGAELTLRDLGVEAGADAIDDLARDVAEGLEQAALATPAPASEVAEAIRRVERLAAAGD